MSTFLGFPTRRGSRPGPDGGTRPGGPVTTASPGWADDVPHPDAPLRWGETFPEAAKQALGNTQLRRNLAHATSTIRAKRAAVVGEVPDWEALRDAGSAIKAHVMSDLPRLLEELERNVAARGGVVHWARDAAEANRIVADLVKATGETEVVKVKSMVTQEIGLNEALAAEGIAAFETDLAELIVQLADDMPSHILVPAIHRNRSEIREIFLERMGDAPPDLTDAPRELAMAAREHLRRKFLSAKVAISGANFAVADSGTLAVVESEGNGRMCLTLPETLITVMGIEKVIPTYQDLEVFMALLPRSSTGERMNPYTSLWTGVTPGDGPQAFHLVLLDNGRSRALADDVGRAALHCIRCSACLNVCPVYERVGGHAYGSVYPGPIGAVLTPQLTGSTGRHDPNDSLPYASTLCGACYDVCPVKIDIPTLLVHLRARDVDQHRGRPTAWGAAMKAASFAMSDPARFALAERAGGVTRVLGGRSGRISWLPFPGSLWTRSRDLPGLPKQSFRAWWAAEHTSPGPDGGATSGGMASPSAVARSQSAGGPSPTSRGVSPSAEPSVAPGVPDSHPRRAGASPSGDGGVTPGAPDGHPRRENGRPRREDER
jgi:L-lactate dehydrogenase complex protein LldF